MVKVSDGSANTIMTHRILTSLGKLKQLLRRELRNPRRRIQLLVVLLPFAASTLGHIAFGWFDAIREIQVPEGSTRNGDGVGAYGYRVAATFFLSVVSCLYASYFAWRVVAESPRAMKLAVPLAVLVAVNVQVSAGSEALFESFGANQIFLKTLGRVTWWDDCPWILSDCPWILLGREPNDSLSIPCKLRCAN